MGNLSFPPAARLESRHAYLAEVEADPRPRWSSPRCWPCPPPRGATLDLHQSLRSAGRRRATTTAKGQGDRRRDATRKSRPTAKRSPSNGKAKDGAGNEALHVATGKTSACSPPWQESYIFAWSPDRPMVAALRRRRTRHVGPSTWSASKPAGDPDRDRLLQRRQLLAEQLRELVFGARLGEPCLPAEDRRRPRLGRPAGRRLSTLTHDGVSGWPLWGADRADRLRQASWARSSASTARKTTSS